MLILNLNCDKELDTTLVFLLVARDEGRLLARRVHYVTRCRCRLRLRLLTLLLLGCDCHLLVGCGDGGGILVDCCVHLLWLLRWLLLCLLLGRLLRCLLSWLLLLLLDDCRLNGVEGIVGLLLLFCWLTTELLFALIDVVYHQVVYNRVNLK